MVGIADRILRRARAHGKGKWVCTPKDFLDLGSRAAVDQALSRLAKDGKLRRVGRGLYDLPRNSRALKRPAPPNVDAAVAAIARRDGVRLMPDGLVAANRLGLTNAVPAKTSYITDGGTKIVKVGGRTIRLRHASPTVMDWTGRPSAPVVLALRWLGRRNATDDRIVATLKRSLPYDVKQDLLRHSRSLPSWAVPLARSVATDNASA